MLRLAGALLLTAGAAGVGLCAAGQLEERVKSLRSLVAGLEILGRQLAFRRAAMPELMERTACQTEEPARYLFAYCREHLEELGEQTFGAIWAQAAEEEPGLLLAQEERAVLAELGEVLGRYDADDQIAALGRTVDALRVCLTRAQEERRRLGRVYTALGVGSGAMLAILLL